MYMRIRGKMLTLRIWVTPFRRNDNLHSVHHKQQQNNDNNMHTFPV